MPVDDIEITEFEAMEVGKVAGVGTPANGTPILMLKQVADPESVAKDWAAWDAAHEGGGKGGGKAAAGGDTKASAADAVARAKQTIADHKAGKKVTAAELKNAHEVHEAHLAHEAKLKADAEAKAKAAAAKPAAKPAAKKEVAKGMRDCPSCDKSFDADHKGSTCDNCGAKLPDGDDREAAKSLVRGILKAANARGKIDEEPDIAGGTAVLAQIADLIIAEAQELKAGQAGEIADIQQLACAAEMIWCWRTGEEAVGSGSVMPATMLMQSAASILDWPGELTAEQYRYVTKEKHNTADRKKLAEQGNALSDGSYPIADEEDLKSAAILAQSGHGDVEGAKRLIGRRAKELGVKNPLESDGDTSKSQIADEGTDVDTVTQEDDGQIAKAVKEAVTKAVAASEERFKALEAELAKVKATPIPGGPVMTAAAQRSSVLDGEAWAAKARYYREMADSVSQDPKAADGYRQLARQAEEHLTAS